MLLVYHQVPDHVRLGEQIVGGTDIDGVVDPVPRSGSTGGTTAGFEVPLLSMESASLLALLRARLPFRERERNPCNYMSASRQRGWKCDHWIVGPHQRTYKLISTSPVN